MVEPALITTTTMKLLYSYGGKILPRYPDGKLHYVGGHTRILAVDRSITFAELVLKLGDLCGTAVILRCQLPTQDADALVSIKCDQDLTYLIEEYDLTGNSIHPSTKIRAFISVPSPRSVYQKTASPPSSDTSSPKSVLPSIFTTCSFHFTPAARSSSPRLPMPADIAAAGHRAPLTSLSVRLARKGGRYCHNQDENQSAKYVKKEEKQNASRKCGDI